MFVFNFQAIIKVYKKFVGNQYVSRMLLLWMNWETSMAALMPVSQFIHRNNILFLKFWCLDNIDAKNALDN